MKLAFNNKVRYVNGGCQFIQMQLPSRPCKTPTPRMNTGALGLIPIAKTPKNIFNAGCFLGVFEGCAMTDDFFRNRLDQMIDLRHPLAVLASRMPWQEIEASLAQRWARQVKAGRKIDGLDLFGPVSVVAGAGVSNAGRPRLPTCLMVALLYLKHVLTH